MKIPNGKEITIRYYGKKILVATYYGLNLIWQAVRSCFGAGYWRGDKPWDGSDAWKG